MKNEVKSNDDNTKDFILAVDIIDNENFSNILNNNETRALRISVFLPKFIDICKNILKTKKIHENIPPDQFKMCFTKSDFISRLA